VVDGDSGLLSRLVTGRTEKRLTTGTVDLHREEVGSTRGTSGCSDMRRFSNEGGDEDATDSTSRGNVIEPRYGTRVQ